MDEDDADSQRMDDVVVELEDVMTVLDVHGEEGDDREDAVLVEDLEGILDVLVLLDVSLECAGLPVQIRENVHARDYLVTRAD